MRKETLTDFLLMAQQERPEAVFKVGSSGGHSYFYIGTAAGLLGQMEDLSRHYRRSFRERWINEQTALEMALSLAPTPGRFADAKIKAAGEHKAIAGKKSLGLTMESYDQYVREWMKSVEMAYAKAATAKMKHEAFTPLDGRIVQETFRSIVPDEDATVVMINGYEAGRYWLVSELKNGVQKDEGDDDDE